MWKKTPWEYDDVTMRVKDPEGRWDAFVRWDGCITLTQYFNGPMDLPNRNPDDEDSMHICDIDDLISRLQSLKTLAIGHFKGNWPS